MRVRDALFLVAVFGGAPIIGCATGSSVGNGGGGSGGGGGGGVCAPGSTMPCYTGPSGTLGVGVCKGGEQTCNAEGSGFGLCEGEVTPTAETCATPDDDDCDGTALDEDAGCVCLPNTSSPCYSGPPGTQDVGVCKGGMTTCNAAGTASGVCAGEVVPAAEDCMTPEDDDCDGLAPACSGDEVWAKRFGDATSQIAKGVAVRLDGTSFVTGYMNGAADFGAGVLTSAGATDAFLAKLDANGSTLWAQRFGDGGNQEARAVAVDSTGSAAITGTFTGAVDFGGGAITSAGSNDIFVAKLGAAGNHVWSKGFGNGVNQYGNAVAFAPNSEIVIAGHLSGTVDFGGGVLTGAGGNDAFVARLGVDGSYKWAKIFGDDNNQYAYGVAVAPAGNVVLGGSFGGQIDFGAGALSTAGQSDIFLASFDGAGNLGWGKRFGDGAEQFGYAVAVDSGTGNIAITGSFVGSVNFGGGALGSQGGSDVFVAVFTSSGSPVYGVRLGDVGDDAGRGVAFDAAGYLFVTGSFGGANGNDVFVARLDTAGVPVWSKQFGDASDQSGLAVGADGANHVYVAGGFMGDVDFGGGSLVSAGSDDAFVAKFFP